MMNKLQKTGALLLLAGLGFIFSHSELHPEHCGQNDHHSGHDYCQLVKSTHISHSQSTRKPVEFQWSMPPLASISYGSLDYPASSCCGYPLIEHTLDHPFSISTPILRI
jgi:hypothetical protein